MAKFCTECSKEIADGVAFCTECGTKAPADAESATTETATEVNETKAETPVVHTPKAQNERQPRENYEQPASDKTNKVVGTGAYFGLMLLFAIPIIGFIACIIMAFAPKNKNVKHFAGAVLIWMVIGLVLIGILAAIITLLTNVFTNVIDQLTDGQFQSFGDLFGQLGDLEGLMEQFGSGDLEGLMEQYGNGDLEGLMEEYGNSGLESLPIE